MFGIADGALEVVEVGSPSGPALRVYRHTLNPQVI